MTFMKIKKSTQSIAESAKGNLVFGVGVNDAWYQVVMIINGKKCLCNTYVLWKAMLNRCYGELSLSKQPTYKDCNVCEEWLLYSNFEKWCDLNYVYGYDLDKDLKIKNNKIYCPENCLFVPRAINNVINVKRKCGIYPVGVTKCGNSYRAKLSIDSVRVSLGCYSTPEIAYEVYKNSKNKELDRKSIQYPEFAKYIKQHKIRD